MPTRYGPLFGLLSIGFIVLLFNSGSRFSIGLLLKPMADELLATRSAISLSVAVFMIVTALSLPIVGQAVDRLGAMRVLFFGAVLSAVSLLIMAVIQTPLQAVAVYGVLFGIGSAATSITPVGVMITQTFPGWAGFANSIATAGMGVGQLLIVMALSSQIEALGWRGTFLVLAGLNAFVLLPLLVVVARRSRATLSGARRVSEPSTRVEVSYWRSKPLWLLCSIYAICGLQDFFTATHVVALATDQGMSDALAGQLLALMGLTGLIGVLFSGYWADRHGPWMVLIGCFLVRMVIFAGLLIEPSTPIIVVFALAFGATFWMSAPLTVVFVRSLFGMRQLGTISGFVTMVHHCAGGVGAYLGAVLFDAQGDYSSMLALLLGGSIVALLLSTPLRSAGATRCT